MGKSVSLSLHRNKVEARRKRDLARVASRAVEEIVRTNDVRAFAFVAIDASGAAHCQWDTGAILPIWAFAPTVSAALQRSVEYSGVDEDWKPSLTLKGGSS